MPHLISERVVIYARVSTDMQAEEGLSIAAQLAEMRDYASQKGWTVVAEFVDPGVTGRTLDRPGLQDLLAAAEQRSFDIVLVHELSRLSRSVFDTFAFFEMLGKYNVGFASVKEPQFDLSTPTGRLLLTFIAGINQYYIDMLRLHTKKSKRQRARQGLYNASIPPYGYRHAGDARTPPVIVEEEAQVVRMAFERYAGGRHTYQDVADLLNAAGFHTRRGRRFSKDTVADMIRNRFYAGKIVYKEGKRGNVGDVYPGQHEPIISEELYEATCQVRGKHRRASHSLQRRTRPYLLNKLARCHACGRRLRAQSGKYMYYREMSYERGYLDCPNARVGVRADKLHRQIGAIVRQIELPPDWQEELAQMIGDDEETATLRNRRARLVARRRRLKQAFLRGDFDEDEDIYRQELEQVRRELDKIPAGDDLYRLHAATELLESLAEVWDQADPMDQRDLVQLMLREVKVDVPQGRVLFLRPLISFIPLFRSISILREHDLGTFVPIWQDEIAGAPGQPSRSPLVEVPEDVVDLPLLPIWPWEPAPTARISRPLSSALKARRKAGYEGGLITSVPHPGVPSVLLDERKWPEVSLKVLTLAELEAMEAGTAAYVDTPLVLQTHAARKDLAETVFQLLSDAGHWHMIDLVPASMPGHWVFGFFPEAWKCARSVYATVHTIFNTLRKIGFQVKIEEHTLYWPVALETALQIARCRPGLLAEISDQEYQKGIERLEVMASEQGKEALMPSEVTLIEVTAVKREVD